MTGKKTLKPEYTDPVIYIHAKDSGPLSDSLAQSLLELGMPLCSHLGYSGFTKTAHGYDKPAMLMAELVELFPDRPIIFLRAGLLPAKSLIDKLVRLLELNDQPLALTVLSNADHRVNPFSGLQDSGKFSDYDFARLVSLLSPGKSHTLTDWTNHFVLLSAELAKRLARQDAHGTMMQRLTAVGGSLKVADHLFLHDQGKRTIAPLSLQPYETAYPPPFGELNSRLQNWFNAGITELPFPSETKKPATLHITHSWGGGVAIWLNSFIETDQGQQHYQLHSENPQTGRGFGQKLSLYAGNELRSPIASWWLTPAIQSVSDNHKEYRIILSEICTRYDIGRVMVSSLIGHSLDALRTAIPTLQILHDHFPVWPLLSVNPEPYLVDNGPPKLELALKDHSRNLEFKDKDALAWSKIGAAYLQALASFGIKVVAPSASVLDLQNQMSPVFKNLQAKIIPHGFPVIKKLRAVKPKERADGRLRLVILGRMQTGKGQNLLIKALPELAKHVQVYLLGTGKSGEAFFGMPGVDVILEYGRDELSSVMNTIGPHFAALLSVVPETYSFTLSELQQMRIPLIATRMGSFPERIDHGKTGWLIDTNPMALTKQVTKLVKSPDKIEFVRSNLAKIKRSSPKRMLTAYNQFCPLTGKSAALDPTQAGFNKKQLAAELFQYVQLDNKLQKTSRQYLELVKDAEQKSKWALETERQLKLEQKRRAEWVDKLEAEIELEQISKAEWVEKLEAEIEQEQKSKAEWVEKLEAEIEQERERRNEWVERLEVEIERLQQLIGERQASLESKEKQVLLVQKDYKQLETELALEQKRRKKWIKKLEDDLKLEQKTRTEWVGKLESEIEQQQQVVAETQTNLELIEGQLQQTQVDFKQLETAFELEKKSMFEWVESLENELEQEKKSKTEWVEKLETELEQERKSKTEWVEELETELEQERKSKTEWVEKLETELEQEQKSKIKWVEKLEAELEQEQKTKLEWVNKLEVELKLEQNNKTEWVGKLENELEQLQKDLLARQKYLASVEGELHHTQADYKNLEADIQLEQNRRVEWVGKLENEIGRLQKMVAETQKSLKTAKQQLHLVQEKYKQLESEIEQLEQTIAEKQADLRFSEGQLQLSEEDYRQLAATHHNLQTDRHELGLVFLQLERDHKQLQGNYQFASDQNDQIFNSTSWKITKPFRATCRVGRNFKQARAWNPLRWPGLISKLFRNLATLGFGGTILRLQTTVQEVKPEPQPSIEVETLILEKVLAPSAFPEIIDPKVSIVIPVYNKWAYTAACLVSLLEFKGKYSFEVIVVDDQSSDETADELAKIAGVTHLRNETNLGFVESCNRGARLARGEFLVLLNNDTQVTKGWLDELIDTFDREPQAGLVGSRLVYPNGKLQESGGIIFNDASGWNYGREQDAENPEYHYLRESDYCSGACIALKTEYFNALGAFDERYAPAYYEDTDLAFKVREAGQKVYIQPSSVIIHHEGITSGTDIASGTKKYQVINREKFAERWKTELQHQPPPIHNPNDHAEVFRASQHRLKKRILIIDATTPEPDKDSGSVRLTNLMQCCRDLGYGVTFFADNRAYVGKYTRDLQKSGIEVLYDPWLNSLHDFFSQRGSEFDYVFISRHYIAVNYVSLIKRYCPQAKFIFDTVDLHYLREQRHAALEQSKTLKLTARQTRRQEIIVIKASDATLVVSTVEQAVLAKDAPGEKVHILSNIHQVPGRDKSFADRQDIFFVGGYQHPPNVDAALWFVNDIWPLIRKKLPEVRFHLIGSKAPKEIEALDGNGVVFHGFVDSIDPFLSDCRVAIAPLRYGAGVKGKVNMSMAHGQPVVATPAAVEGMFAEHERELLVAQDAESFAAEVVRLYQDEKLWNHLSDASIQNVEEHFSLATARESLKTLFNSFED